MLSGLVTVFTFGKLYVTKPVFLSEFRLLWRLSASFSFFFYPPVFVKRKTKITFLVSMLWCSLPARRIGQRWGATRAPRRGNDGGAGHAGFALLLSCPS